MTDLGAPQGYVSETIIVEDHSDVYIQFGVSH